MHHNFLLSFLGSALALLCALMLFPMAVAFIAGETLTGILFFASLAFSVFIAGLMLFTGRKANPEITRADLCLFAFLGWVVVGAFAALPLWLVLEMPIFKAYFLSQSALTTTGAMIFTPDVGLDLSIKLWLALLQWLGGFASILMAMVVLAPLGIGGMEMRQVAGTNDTSKARGSLLQGIKIVAPLYGAFSLLCFLLLLPQAGFFDALCLTFSTISTGGMFLAENTQLLTLPYVKLILAIFMLLGAMNLVQYYLLLRRRTSFRKEKERTVFLIFVAVIGLVLTFLVLEENHTGDENVGGFVGGWGALFLQERWFSALGEGFFAAISVISTTNFQSPGIELPFILTLLLTFVGGMTLSTAGGLKMMRILLLLTQGRKELSVLAYPHDVKTVSFEGYPVHIDLMQTVWVFFTLFVASIAILMLVFSFTGLQFEHSLAAAVAAIANAGPMLDMVGINSIALYANLPAAASWAMSLGMIGGRVELLALLSLFSSIYWKRL